METIKALRDICQSPKRKNPTASDWGYLKHRFLSIYITKVVLQLGKGKIKPNSISIFNILFGIIVLALLALIQVQFLFLLLLFLFYFSFLLDKVDVEVARYQKNVTLRGEYLDIVYHLFVQNGFILVLGINRYLISGEQRFLFLGMAGYFLFFLSRYIRKLKYFLYVKYRLNKDEGQFKINKKLGRVEKLFVSVLNSFPLKLYSISRRHDAFLFLVIVLSILCFNSMTLWFWLLLIWVAMSMIYVLRFLFLNYFYIDTHIELIHKKEL